MDQEKFGKFIKEIRKKNHLTQKDLADKYNVTYQAVSKWENGRNMPDKALIMEISKDFGISVEELIGGEYNSRKKRNLFLIISICLSVLTIIGVACAIYLNKSKDFEFKTLTTSCNDFNISGSIAYNDRKSAIYITNIEYCGGEDAKKYKKLECNLYETDTDIEKKISSYSYEADEPIVLEKFLKELTLAVDDYRKVCKDFTENNLYLTIHATDEEDLTTVYRIPLTAKDKCNG